MSDDPWAEDDFTLRRYGIIGWDLGGKDETVMIIPPAQAADEHFMRELRRLYPGARVVISQKLPLE